MSFFLEIHTACNGVVFSWTVFHWIRGFPKIRGKYFEMKIPKTLRVLPNCGCFPVFGIFLYRSI